ncbi:SRPBCC family protein [Luteipulveratus mongoliensis]|uniref:Polyketide cyclase n=1 Tax=Luteipulveratus mongoliensis TaxID=571913 RepID=A0A0K1JNG2_9MICO|nr:SRPBCC domain-containing protein [Luteipulveratus mongoliensis]AKU18249.1 polyketide cyclase [Luteipulveratus mongoliensis]
MVDILHKIAIKSEPKAVYDALTTIEGLSGWWTRDTSGDPAVGGVVQFRFEQGGFDMKVIESEPGEKVLWEVVDGPEEWVGTHVHWDLRHEDDYTVVMFKHEGWKEPVDFMYHCSTHWAMFLISLRSLVETGTGAPGPVDIKPDARF